MPGDAVVKLRALRISQGCRVRFQAFPDRIEQFRLLRRGEAFYLASQVAHMPITLALFALGCKLYLHEPAVLFFSCLFSVRAAAFPVRRNIVKPNQIYVGALTVLCNLE